MALYSVYTRSNADPLAPEKVRLIRPGFSWLAFLFPVIWLLFNGVWRWFLVILALELGLVIAIPQIGLPEWSLFLAGLAIMAYVGVSGRDWLGAALERRGFKLMATVAGEDEDEAYAAFVRRPKPPNSTVSETKPVKPAETGPIIGLFPDPEARI